MSTIKDNVTRVFHWVSAVLIVYLLTIGFYMTLGEHDYSYYDLHKSFGITALVLIVARLYWRQKHAWQSSSKDSPQEKTVSFFHKSLIAMLILMPLSGVFNSGFGGYGIYLMSKLFQKP